MQPRVQRPFKTAAQRMGALLSSPGGVRARAELRRALSDADGLSPERPNWEPSNSTAMPLQVSPLHGRRHSVDPHRCPGEVLRPSPASQTRQELQPPPAGLWSPRLGPVGCSLQGCAAALALAACWLSAVALVPDRTVRAQMLATPPAPASHGAPPPPKP
ncbi:MAG: hypothetical protein ACK46L_08450, partial [Synechococcaceae cyanobacterium]